jgi:aryl-phospho-beta-D-glucosidase BglC (GH1 family)
MYSKWKRIFIIIIIIATIILSFSPDSYTQAKFVTVQGKQIIAPDGQPLLLKGINLGNWLVPEGYMFKFSSASSPHLIYVVLNQLIGEDKARKFWKNYRDNYITGKDIQFIKKAGFNSVRIPFNYRLFVLDTEPPLFQGVGYSLLDNVIGWCSEAGLLVILDMHAAPGGQTGDNIDDSWGYPYLFENPESQELTVQIWQKLAERYRDEATVIGYDLLNEPIATYFDSTRLNPLLGPLYKKIVAGIREVDPNHLIFLGGAQWNNNFKVFGPPFDNKLVYTFHKYWMEVKQEAIQEYANFSNKYNVPVWMGESGENKDEWIAAYRTLLEKNGIGWCFWPYKKLDATSCVVSINKFPEWDAIIHFANHPRTNFEDIRKNRPSEVIIDAALAKYLENIKLNNCRINEGYLRALGL